MVSGSQGIMDLATWIYILHRLNIHNNLKLKPDSQDYDIEHNLFENVYHLLEYFFNWF